MKKRILAILLALALMLSLLPSVVIAEGEEPHIHCLCGSNKTKGTVCSECGSEAVEWTGITALPANDRDGYYYLTDTITKTTARDFSHNVAFCLNGHNIETVGEGCMGIKNGGVVSITDCDGDDTKGLITGTTAKATLPVLAGSTLKLYGGTISGNTNGTSTGAGTVWLQNGTATTDGGAFYMYGGKIVGNTTKRGAVFAEFPTATTKPAIIQILGGEITGNTGTNTAAGIGGGAGIYAAVNVVVGGDAKVYGNIGSVTGASAPNADIYLRNDNAAYSGQLVVSAEVPLETGANICYGSNPVEADLTELKNITGTPNASTWDSTWVTYDGKKVSYADGKFFTDTSAPQSHIHCLCGAEVNEGVTCELCGSVAVEWTQTDTMPSVAGNYYLTGQMQAEKVSIEQNIAICLHGQNIKSTAGDNIFDIKTGGVLTITECQDQLGSITGVTKNCAILVGKGGALKLYDGKISGNSYTTGNGSGTILLHQGDATTNGGAFYMYGGEISGNTNLRGTIFTNIPANATNKTAIVQILGGTITGNTGTQTAAGMGGGAGIYAFTPVVIGGDAVVAGNDAKVNADDIYLRCDGIFTGALVVSADVPLKDGANIHYGSNPAEADLTNLKYITGNPANWSMTWVTYNDEPVDYKNSVFFTQEPVPVEKHVHCLCGAETTEGNTCVSCGSKAVSWTGVDSMPADNKDGYYYLTDTITKTTARDFSHNVAFCLNGHNIETVDDGCMGIKNGGVVSITDCDGDDTKGLITGTTAKATLPVLAGSTLKLYGGTISGNTNGTSTGAGIIWLQNGTADTDGGAFYMYGGKIVGNTTKRGAVFAEFPTAGNKPAIIQILGGEITGNTGTNTAAGIGGGAGIYAAVNVVVGGEAKVYGNIASVSGPNADIYLRNDNEVYSGQLVVSSQVPLTADANIHYGTLIPDNEDDLQFITGTPDEETWNNSWILYDGAPVKYKDGKFYTSADIVISSHDHDGKNWISVTEETTLLPNKTGYYVLDGDVKLPKQIILSAGMDVTICLNGHALTAAEGSRHFDVNAGAKLTICDCTAKTENGKYTAGKICGGSGNSGAAIIVRAGGEVYLHDGIMCDNTASNNGGFIYLDATSDTYPGAVFHMYGGMICNNYGPFGAVRLAPPTGGQAGCVFIMEDGWICHNESPGSGGGIHAAGGATIELRGGVIEENIAAQGGGAVSINGNTVVELSGTVIRNNTATKWGGGFYIRHGATLNMTGGEISGNSSKIGAGVLMDYAGTVMNLSGGIITGNKAGTAGGGGIYASTNTVFNMTGGTVSKNESEAVGGGIAMNGAKGNLTGGEISKNVAVERGGGVYASCSADNTGKIIIDGAQIINNTAGFSGGGVFIQNEISFTMESGSVSGNTAKSGSGCVASLNSVFTLNGGTISGNYSQTNGGGLYALGSKIYLNGGSVSGNTAKAAGGGVFIDGAKAQLNGTSVSYNHSETGSGGGVMVNSTTMKVDGVATRFVGRLDINGGYIGYNTTKKAAGGLLVQAKDTVVNMYGGKISNNTATKFSGGVYVGKDAMFNMHGGAVCYNVAETDVAGGIRHDAGGGNYTGGEVYGNTCARSGGGIVVGGTNNKVTMKNLKIYENFAKIGGGLVHQSNGAVLEMEDCEIYNNTVSQDAAGVYVATYCYYFANNCHIHDNVAPGNGGGVYSWATSNVYLTDCLIENNEAKAQGGGVWTRGDGFYITGCTIRNNTASGHGGGVCTGMMGSATHVWTPGMQIKDTLFENNTSGGIGGGLYLSGGAQGNLRDVTFTANAAAAEGGAFWAKDELIMHGITATGNQSGGEGYAIYLDDSEFDGHSYVAAVMQISGDMKIHDNINGDLYLGEETTLLISEELLGESTKMVVTLHSGLLTQLVWGAYDYEGGNLNYVITYGNRSMTDPEILTETDEPLEDPTQQGGQNVEGPTDGQQKNEPKGKTGLIVGIAAVAAVIVAAAVILVAAASKKKKVTK